MRRYTGNDNSSKKNTPDHGLKKKTNNTYYAWRVKVVFLSGCKDMNGTREIIPIGMPIFPLASRRHYDYKEKTIKIKTDNVVELVKS